MRIVELLLVLLSIVVVGQGREVNIEVTCNTNCYNGGRCEVTVDSDSGQLIKQCACPPPYTGEYCENYLTPVNCDKACVHGKCDVIVGPKTEDGVPYSLKCVCDPNYHYEFCSFYSERPTCDPPCVDGHGECILLENSRLAPHLQDHTYCNCSATPTAFYYGKACEHEEIITCNPPCVNDGICEVIERKGQCKCSRNSTGSFSGYRCSTFDADCNPPCLNGGKCHHGSYCSCAKTSDGQYTGDRCQNFSKKCDPPCLNGGLCSDGYCSCDYTKDGYYSGIKCENFTKYIVRNDCYPDCVNGECLFGWCRCWSNSTVKFTGYTCEIATRKSDPCPAPCQNGGICEFGSCSCVSNSSHFIHGSSCEYSQACFCENGGSCTYGSCDCPFRYTGDKCETYLSECPCKNGGSCEVNSNYCHCTGNETHYFLDQYCEVSRTIYCFPAALNGGWCSRNHYTCPYDSHGYFYGDQCLKYKSTAYCDCPEHQVCSVYGCRCPYSLMERFFTYGPSCEIKRHV